MNIQKNESLSIIKEAAKRRQQQTVASEKAERENARWQYRLKQAIYSGVVCTLVMALLVLGTAFPWLYPRDLDGFGILLGVSVLLSAYFFIAFYVQEWVEGRQERYWFWRTTSVLILLALAGFMLYGMFFTADYWLPHFR